MVVETPKSRRTVAQRLSLSLAAGAMIHWPCSYNFYSPLLKAVAIRYLLEHRRMSLAHLMILVGLCLEAVRLAGSRCLISRLVDLDSARCLFNLLVVVSLVALTFLVVSHRKLSHLLLLQADNFSLVLKVAQRPLRCQSYRPVAEAPFNLLVLH